MGMAMEREVGRWNRVTIVDWLALFRVTKRFCISCGQRSCSGSDSTKRETAGRGAGLFGQKTTSVKFSIAMYKRASRSVFHGDLHTTFSITAFNFFVCQSWGEIYRARMIASEGSRFHFIGYVIRILLAHVEGRTARLGQSWISIRFCAQLKNMAQASIVQVWWIFSWHV